MHLSQDSASVVALLLQSAQFKGWVAVENSSPDTRKGCDICFCELQVQIATYMNAMLQISRRAAEGMQLDSTWVADMANHGPAVSAEVLQGPFITEGKHQAWSPPNPVHLFA